MGAKVGFVGMSFPVLSHVAFIVEEDIGLMHSFPIARVWGFSEQRAGPFWVMNLAIASVL